MKTSRVLELLAESKIVKIDPDVVSDLSLFGISKLDGIVSDALSKNHVGSLYDFLDSWEMYAGTPIPFASRRISSILKNLAGDATIRPKGKITFLVSNSALDVSKGIANGFRASYDPDSESISLTVPGASTPKEIRSEWAACINAIVKLIEHELIHSTFGKTRISKHATAELPTKQDRMYRDGGSNSMKEIISKPTTSHARALVDRFGDDPHAHYYSDPDEFEATVNSIAREAETITRLSLRTGEAVELSGPGIREILSGSRKWVQFSSKVTDARRRKALSKIADHLLSEFPELS